MLIKRLLKFTKKIDFASWKSNVKIKNIENKIPGITNLTTNITLNAKINEVKKEIPCITNLVTTAAINTKINEVKNKILLIKILLLKNLTS